MAYCTQENIISMLDEDDVISLTDDFGSGEIDEAVVLSAIRDADALIDSYAGKKYEVPLDPVPEIARKLSVDIAVYNLFSRRSRVTDVIKKRFDDALHFLKDVSKNAAQITGARESAGTKRDDFVQISSSPRIFSHSSLKGF